MASTRRAWRSDFAPRSNRLAARTADRTLLGYRRHAAHPRPGRHVRVGRWRQADHREGLPAAAAARARPDRLSDRREDLRAAPARTPRAAGGAAGRGGWGA